jgi:hypothetical protein
VLFKNTDHRKFSYTSLYYKPEKDPDRKTKERIRFRRWPKRTAWRRIVLYAVLFLLILAILKKLAIFG